MCTLKEKITRRIREEGPISFETFMDMALYEPGLGYYAKDSTEIGRSADFYTSSHLHRAFGAMLGRQAEEMWELTGRPARFDIVEMGAGMGYLAKDLLDYLQDRPLGASLVYTIAELNPSVRRRQQDILGAHSVRVRWLGGLESLEPVTGCFLSNELPDAFPVHLIVRDGELGEVFVTVDEQEEIAEVVKPCSPGVIDYLNAFAPDLPEGYRTEVNLRMRDWIRSVSGRLDRGFIITIDYGYPAWEYYSAGRNRGTLLCYHRHKAGENPYEHIGDQDMTAHVNFSALHRWGEASGLRTIGFSPQGSYLIALGIDELITEWYGSAPDAFEVSPIKNLILPQGLGESHKVMVQSKGMTDVKLRGFSLRNQVRML